MACFAMKTKSRLAANVVGLFVACEVVCALLVVVYMYGLIKLDKVSSMQPSMASRQGHECGGRGCRVGRGPNMCQSARPGDEIEQSSSVHVIRLTVAYTGFVPCLDIAAKLLATANG